MSQQVTTGVPSEPVGPSAASPYAVTSHVVVPRDRAAGAPEAGLSASPSGSESDLASGIRISASVGDGSARWTGWNPICARYPEPPKTRSVLPAGARPGGRVPRHEPTADARLWWLKRVEGASYPPRRGGGSRPIDGDLTDVMASPDEWRRVRVSPLASPQPSPSSSARSLPQSPTAAAPAAERPRSNLKAVEATKVFYKSRGLDDGKHVLIGVAGHFKPGLGVAAEDVVTLVGKVVRREAAQGPFVVVYFDLVRSAPPASAPCSSSSSSPPALTRLDAGHP